MTNLPFAPPDLGTVLLLSGLPGGSNKIQDRSPYGNIGTITGAIWVRLPSGLWCLSFDGNDDYVEMVGDGGAASPLNFTSGDFSIELWIDGGADVSGQQTLFMRGDFRVDGYGLLLAGGSVYLRTFQSGAHQQTSGGTLSTNQWTHLLITRQGASVKIYQDGVDATASSVSHIDPATSSRTPKIAVEDDKSSYPFTGKIALLRIYNRALSALEIQNHFNREKHLFGVC